MSQASHHKWIILSLMITIIIDVMGAGLVFPLFPGLFFSSHSVFMAQASMNVRHTFYAIAIGAWPLGIFLATPLWGSLSDVYGRKKMLVYCLGGTALTYLLAGVSVWIHSVTVFILSRLLSGFFAGSFSLAQATLADISTPETKARNMSWVTLAFSLGFVVGPFITSLLSMPIIAKWMSITTPFWVACVLSCLNMTSLMVLLKETTIVQKLDHRLNFITTFIESFRFIFHDARTKVLAWSMFGVQLGWNFYILSLPMVLDLKFGYNTHQLGIFFTALGMCLLVMQLIIMPILLEQYELRDLFISSSYIIGFLFLFDYILPFISVYWLVMVISTMADLLCYNSLSAMLSNSVSQDEQGKVLGGAGALFGLGGLISAAMMSFLANINLLMPFIFGGICFIVAGILVHKNKQRAS